MSKIFYIAYFRGNIEWIQSTEFTSKCAMDKYIATTGYSNLTYIPNSCVKRICGYEGWVGTIYRYDFKK